MPPCSTVFMAARDVGREPVERLIPPTLLAALRGVELERALREVHRRAGAARGEALRERDRDEMLVLGRAVPDEREDEPLRRNDLAKDAMLRSEERRVG